MNSHKKKLFLFIKFLISAGLMAFLFYKIDLQGLVSRLRSLDISFFIIMLALPHINILISSLKWQWLLGALSIKESLGHLFSVYMIGTFFSNFLPSMIGGDIFRIFHLSRNNSDAAGIIAATFTERFMGLTALISIVLLILCHPKIYSVFPLITTLAPAALLIYILLLVFIFNRKYLVILEPLRHFKIVDRILVLIQEAQKHVINYKVRKRVVLASYFISFVFYVITMLTVYVASRTLNISIQFDVIMLVVPLVLLVGMIPISIGGLGLNESSYVFFFTLFGMTSVDAFSIALLLRVRILLTGIIGGMLFVNSKTIFMRNNTIKR